MGNELMTTVYVKQTLSSKVAFKAIIIAGRLRLISLETAVKVANNLLENGAFRYRIGKDGEWNVLDGMELTVSDGDD